MKYKIKKSLQRHFSIPAFVKMVLFMVIILGSTRFASSGILYAYEGLFTTQTDWFEYQDPYVYPREKAFERGEIPRFGSNIIYHKDQFMRWEDTLWCEHGDDGSRKYATQYWPPQGTKGEFKEAGQIVNSIAQDSFWDYTEEEISPDATQCRMCGVAIAQSTHGHDFPWTYCSVWFDVNK